MTMIEDREIKQRLENSVAPCRCKVIIDPYGQHFSYKIFGNDDEVIAEEKNKWLLEFCDEEKLERHLRDLRYKLEEKGQKLNPWP